MANSSGVSYALTAGCELLGEGYVLALKPHVP